MKNSKRHPTKKWHVSIIEFKDVIGSRYKVTRSVPDMNINETRFFRSKQKARGLFNKWLE